VKCLWMYIRATLFLNIKERSYFFWISSEYFCFFPFQFSFQNLSGHWYSFRVVLTFGFFIVCWIGSFSSNNYCFPLEVLCFKTFFSCLLPVLNLLNHTRCTMFRYTLMHTYLDSNNSENVSFCVKICNRLPMSQISKEH
jgi:hypothetical protein